MSYLVTHKTYTTHTPHTVTLIFIFKYYTICLGTKYKVNETTREILFLLKQKNKNKIKACWVNVKSTSYVVRR